MPLQTQPPNHEAGLPLLDFTRPLCVLAGGWGGGTFILRGHSEIGSQSLLPGKILDKDAHGSIT